MSTRSPISTRRFGVGLVALAVVAGVAWLAVLAVVAPLVLGWRSVVVTSGSMEPALHRGDVVLAPRYDGRPLGAGTVVIFRDGERGLVTHRVVSRSDDGTYVTRGDANAAVDSTPVTRSQIEATGRAMVPRIGIISVLAGEGRWGALAVLAAIAGGLGAMARWAMRGRPRALDAGAVTAVPHGRARVVLGTATALQLTVALAALPGARAAWAAPTTNGASTLQATTAWPQSWYLDTTVEGAPATSAPYLRIGTVAPSYAGAVPNYDTDRDADLGLTLAPSSLGLAETDPTKFQLWSAVPVPGAFNIAGTMRLRLPTAVRNFHPTAKGRMIAGLYLCNNPPSACTLHATATVDRPTGWSGSLTTFVNTVFDFGAVNLHVPASRGLAVKVVVDGAGSDDSMWLAYDTTAWPAALQLS